MGVGALSPRYLAAKVKERAGVRFLGKSLDKEVAMLEEVRNEMRGRGWFGREGGDRVLI
jgi:hypothetical protein